MQIDAVDRTGAAENRPTIELNEFELAKVLISQHGTVVLYSPNDLMIYLFSINGKFLCEMDAMERLHAWVLTTDGECLITGSERMVVKLRCLDDLHTMHTFQPLEAPIHSLALTPEENILLVRAATVVVESKWRLWHWLDCARSFVAVCRLAWKMEGYPCSGASVSPHENAEFA